jgi:hypothetical protein
MIKTNSLLILLILVVLPHMSTLYSQSNIKNMNESAINTRVLSDEEKIRDLLFDLVHGVRNRQPIRIARVFSGGLDLKGATRGGGAFLAESFSIDSILTAISGDKAIVECWVFDRGPKGFKESLSLSRSGDYWAITNAPKLARLMEQYILSRIQGISQSNAGSSLGTTVPKVASYSVSQSSASNIPSLIMSNRAVIRRLIPYTSVWSINEDVAQQNLGQRLFVNPRDGEVVKPTGSSDYVAIVADRSWDRIVYGSLNGSWVKSYGDNAGDYQFSLPTGIDIDASGNIYCIDGIRRVIFKLNYNISGTVSFSQEFSLSNVADPVDIDIDPLGEGFWLVDRSANAVVHVSNTGQVIGIATRAIDVFTGASYDFSGPTKVLSYKDYYKYVSLIDLEKRRVITVCGVSFQGNALSGYVTVCEFDQQTNVSLSSLGIDYGSGHALWATDERNGMLHTFDVANYTNGGYLASIKTTGNGEVQWTTPKAFASTTMSPGSVGNIEFLTLDNWSVASGINSYLPGADFKNPYTEFFDWTSLDPTWWGTIVGAILPSQCRMKLDLYRSDGLFIKTKSDGSWTTPASRSGVAIMASDVGSPIGRFRARFDVTPAFNSSYGEYQQSPIVNDVWFSMPLKGTLSGPSTVYHPGKGQTNQYTWTYNVTSGAPAFAYTWKKNGYVVGGNFPTYTEYYSFNGFSGGSYQFTLEVTVTDQSSPTQVKTSSMTVTAHNSGGGIEAGAPGGDLAEQIPESYSLNHNFPNPFNPETQISFGLPEPSTVSITIRDLSGRTVLTLLNEHLPAGYHRRTWNGIDEGGNQVSSGVYFCQIRANGDSGNHFTKVMKMALLK